MDSKKRPNKGQTNKISFKNPEKRSEDRYTILLLLRLPDCITMRVESLSRRLNIIFFFLLPLINDGIQSSRKFRWSCMPQFCYFWSPFVYKAISRHFSSSFGQFSCEFYPKLSEIKPQYLWVLPPEGYGLWVIAVVWVMKHFSLQTNSVDSKTWNLREYGVCESWVMRELTVWGIICSWGRFKDNFHFLNILTQLTYSQAFQWYNFFDISCSTSSCRKSVASFPGWPASWLRTVMDSALRACSATVPVRSCCDILPKYGVSVSITSSFTYQDTIYGQKFAATSNWNCCRTGPKLAKMTVTTKGLPAEKSETSHLGGSVPLMSKLDELRAPHIRKDGPIWMWVFVCIDR